MGNSLSSVDRFLVEFEAWSVTNSCDDVEKFFSARDVPVDVAEEIRKVLRLETNLLANKSSANVRNEVPGKRIDAYELVRHIGTGGMGSVWLGEQKAPVKRNVAIKLLSDQSRNPVELAKRLEKEPQILARLTHPNIASVLDAGKTEENVPYFVMEYIDGMSIDGYCRFNYPANEKDSLRKRLQLFLQLCDAIEHIHQKSLLHRDIKPSNVLVTEIDGKPQVKVIDLGLAKVFRESDAVDLETTDCGAILGSPLWMSPEHAANSGKESAIDTRSDIYSLGALLYELVTETSPHESLRHSSSKAKILQAVMESNLERPSTRVQNMANGQISFELPESPIPVWSSLLRRDLDWIAMKALAADKSLRFSSVGSLANDIERFLDGEPVVARPPSYSYRLGKFVSKNRSLVALLSLFIVGLSCAAAASTYSAMVANKARKAAEEQKVATEQAIEFISRCFGSLNVENPGVEYDHSNHQMLMLLKNSIDNESLKNKPLLELSLRRPLAESLMGAGFADEAIGEYGRIVSLSNELYGNADIRTIEAKTAQAWLLLGNGKVKASNTVVSDCKAAVKNHAELETDWALSLRLLDAQLDTETAGEQVPRMAELIESRLGKNSALFVKAKSLVGSLAYKATRYSDAMEAYDEAKRISETVHGEHRITMDLQLKYWRAAVRSMEPEKSPEKEIAAFVERVRRKFGDDHRFSLLAERIQVGLQSRRNVLGNRASTFATLASKFELAFGPDHRETAELRLWAGGLLHQYALEDDAIFHLKKCAKSFDRLDGEDSSKSLYVRHVLGNCYIYSGRNELVMELCNKYIPIAMESLGKGHWITIELRSKKAMCLGLCEMGEMEEAREIFNSAIEDATEAKDWSSVTNLWMRLSETYFLGENKDFEVALEKMTRAFEVSKEQFGKKHLGTIGPQRQRLLILMQMEDYDEGLRTANYLLEHASRDMLRAQQVYLEAKVAKAECLWAQQEGDEAKKLAQSLLDEDSELRSFTPLMDTRAKTVIGMCLLFEGNEEGGDVLLKAKKSLKETPPSREFKWYEKRFDGYWNEMSSFNRTVIEQLGTKR